MKKFLALCCVALTLCAQAPRKKIAPRRSRAGAKASAAKDSALAQRIDALLDDGLSANAFWGLLALDAKTGDVVYARNEHRMFAPASNTKLFTTATALETLGPQFKVRTTVEADAAPVDGVIAGDLVLVGRGDANLSPRVFPFSVKSEFSGPTTGSLDKLADQIVAAGVKSIAGQVVGDDTYFLFERYPEGWTVDDTIWSYGAPVSALTINDNELRLEVFPGATVGEPGDVRLDPYKDSFTIDDRVLTATKDEARRLHIKRETGSRRIEIWGQIPIGDKGYREDIAADDPAEHAARYLRDALIARGVEVKGEARARHVRAGDPAPDAAKDGVAKPRAVIASLESHPLADDLKVVNKASQNLHAEILLRTLGARGGPGSVAAGLAVEKEFLHKAGLSKDEFYFLDGSGLSRAGLVAPNATVRLLTYMNLSPNRDVWLDTLPVGGVDGSLRNRFQTECTTNNIQAKTGSFRHTSALSGYLSASHGRRLIFSIMVNNYNMPASMATGIMDKVLDELCRTE